jgi:hypothetical protein
MKRRIRFLTIIGVKHLELAVHLNNNATADGTLVHF